jgi:hypothetical protein
VFYVVTSPSDAAHIIRNVLSWISEIGRGLSQALSDTVNS